MIVRATYTSLPLLHIVLGWPAARSRKHGICCVFGASMIWSRQLKPGAGLYGELVPQTVATFKKAVEEGTYDGTAFFKVGHFVPLSGLGA